MERRLLTLTLALALTACTPPAGEPPDEDPDAQETAQSPETEPPGDADSEDTDPGDADSGDTGPQEPSDDGDDAGDGATPTVTFPPCEGLLDETDFVHYGFDPDDGVELLTPGPNWGEPYEQVADTRVSQYVEQSPRTEACTWGLPNSGAFFTVVMAAITPDGAEEIATVLVEGGTPEVQPPLKGLVVEFEESVSVYLIQDDALYAFEGGPGSHNSDDAQRHGFAAILDVIQDATTR